MKLALFFSFALSLMAHAAPCKDKNFSNLPVGFGYGEIFTKRAFTESFSSNTPQPAGFPDVFGDSESHCFAVKATYFTHKVSKKNYVMFTTHDDSCDGGNTTGLVVDMATYLKGDLTNSVVAKVSDGELYCTK